MTGVIHRLSSQLDFCWIKPEEDQEIYAHIRDFVDPKIMKPGQKVMFRLKLAQQVGRAPAATDVIAA